MKNMFGTVMVLAGMLFFAGCVDSTTVVKLNPDGSGTIEVDEYFSPQMTQMLDSMASMAAQAPGASAADAPDLFKQMIEDRLEQYGPEVSLESSKNQSNSQGWKGYRAVYAFDDINDLKLEMGNGSAAGQGMSGDGDETKFDFSFTPGSPAVLRMKIAESDQTASEEAASADGMEGMAESMMASMAPMLKGMHVRMMIQLNGRVVESNAQYPVEGRPNAYTLIDLPMDAVVRNPEAMKKLMRPSGASPEALKAFDIDGVMVEEPGREIVVKFK